MAQWILDQRVRTYAYFFLLRSTRPPLLAHDPAVGVRAPEPSGGSVTRWEPVAGLVRVAPLGLPLLPLGAAMDLLYAVLMITLLFNCGWPRRLACG